jgi:hypothetical protein
MAENAHVTSVDALDAFRSGLITYLTKTRPMIEDACDDVARTRQWLQSEQRVHWENQVRQRTKKLEAAQQALFSAGLSNLRDPTMTERNAVAKAKRALDEAVEKLRLVKRWSMEFDTRAEPLVKQLEHLRTVLASDMPKAVAHLGQLIKLLETYAGVSPLAAGAAGPTPAGEAGASADSAEAPEGAANSSSDSGGDSPSNSSTDNA